jgi:hypothetical protein
LGLEGYGGESSLAIFCKIAIILGSPIEQFDDIYVRRGVHLVTREY